MTTVSTFAGLTTNATDLVQGGASIWTDVDINPPQNSGEQDVDLTPTMIGDKTFTLRADNNDNGTQSDTKSITIEVKALTPVIDFKATDDEVGSSLQETSSAGTVRTYAIDLADVPFDLEWETTDVHRAESASNPELSQWANDGEPDEDGGEQVIGKSSKTASDSDFINLYHEQRRNRTYNFVFDGFNRADDKVSKSVNLEVTDQPTIEQFKFADDSPSRVELDGEPGSVASTTVALEVHKLLQGINVRIGDITPAELEDKINFTIGTEEPPTDSTILTLPPTLSAYPAGLVNLERETVLTLEVDQPIYDNEPSAKVEIVGESLNGNLSKTLELDLNIDGFSPRTIEEF